MEAIEITGALMLIQIIMLCAFFAVGLLVMAFWIWMLVDCLTHESSEGNDKLTWMLVIVLTNWIGALIYFIVRRSERRRNEMQRQGLST